MVILNKSIEIQNIFLVCCDMGKLYIKEDSMKKKRNKVHTQCEMIFFLPAYE